MASANEWAVRVGRWRASGQSAAQFAGEAGWNPRTLSWWGSRVAREGRRRQSGLQLVRLVPREPAEVERDAPSIDVVLGRRRTVPVGAGFDPDLLRAEVEALEEG